MGPDWPTASLLARSALLWSSLLLIGWCSAPNHPANIAQEVQGQRPKILEFTPAFRGGECDATRNTDQLCALGCHLLLIQLRHSSALLQLVVQVPLCVYHFLFDTLSHPRISNTPGMIDILSAALDASYSISMVVIYFTLQYPENGRIGLNSIQTWWGNTVYTKTADFKGTPFNTLAEGQTFGPKSW